MRTTGLLALLSSFCVGGCDPGEPDYENFGDDGGYERPAEALPEAAVDDCDTLGEARECMDGEGTEFCTKVDFEWVWGECLITFDCMPGDTKSNECADGGTVIYTCEVDEAGVPYWAGDGCGFTPLVLSFEVSAAIELAPSFAAFDIAGVGECLDSDWPSAATPWLVADLDRNGFIDGGHELFGSGTILESGRRAQNGFDALAAFDGNHDGRITAADPRFAELMVWRDEDADKHSLPFELSPLAHEGVQTIELSYGLVEQCDARGNCGRERSRFEFVARSGQVAVGEVVDIHLACE